MKIRLKDSHTLLSQHARSFSANAGYSRQDREWREILGKVGGMTLTVETEHLFADQFNTAPIPGVSESGIRVMADMVERVLGDVRPRAAKCDWCGRTYLKVPAERMNELCPACDKGRIHRLSPLQPKRAAPLQRKVHLNPEKNLKTSENRDR